MKSSNAIQLAIDLAQRKRDAAAKALAQALQTEQAGQLQLQQLESYARETEAKWLGRGQQGTSAELMHHHFQFLAKLDHAIAFQRNVLQGQGQRVEQARQALLAAEQHQSRFEKIQTMRQQAHALELQRTEQKLMDEMASRMGQKPLARPRETEETLWLSN